jgi:hypothetical protein
MRASRAFAHLVDKKPRRDADAGSEIAESSSTIPDGPARTEIENLAALL